MSKLTDKQSRFISEYLIDSNATQAAIRAGYSKKTARSQGQRMLTNVDIQEAIQSHQDKAAKRNDTTVDLIDSMHRRAYEVAEENAQASAMTVSAQNLAKLHGFLVDRGEITGRDGAPLTIETIITFSGKSKKD